MAHNPLDDGDKERHHRISQRAYHLWQSEGELHGHDQEYWERAQELIGMEESAGAGQLPNPMTVPGNDPSRAYMVEESSIQENLGEFPGRTDQGEEQPFPTAAVTHTAPEVPLAAPKPDEIAKTSGVGTTVTKPKATAKSNVVEKQATKQKAKPAPTSKAPSPPPSTAAKSKRK